MTTLETAAEPHSEGAGGDKHIGLLSWNVAGWKTTLEHIKRLGGLGRFFEKHHASIVCFQETKLTEKAVAEEFVSLAANEPGFDSFWACNEGRGGQRQGLNGVATFTKQGLVVRADPAPLGQPELDSEGRCLLTDHGTFVIFNVYVPNSQNGVRLPFKMRWLHALRAAMVRERAKGKAIVLAGDLNMKLRSNDVHWTGRLLTQTSLAKYSQSESADPDARRVASNIAEHWNDIRSALDHKEIRLLEAGRTEHWGILVETKEGSNVRLGPRFDSAAQARTKFVLNGIVCDEDGSIVSGPVEHESVHVVQKNNTILIHELAESLKKIVGLEVERSKMKDIADAIGQNPTEPPVQDWFTTLLSTDGMVDSFAEFHHEANERFTCWDQSKCLRHDNIGSRIDYVLVDKGFFEKHARRGLGLYTGCVNANHMSSSAEAAKAAAILGGLMGPVGIDDKSGMADLHEEEYRAQFREAPCSGIIYTAQQLSDHVAVSLCLHGDALPSGARVASDPATRLSQPHRTVKRISDFFMKKPSHTSLPAGPTKKQKVAGA